MNKKFFIRNRKSLLEKIQNDSVAIFFSGEPSQKSADEDYNFTPNRDFYYLSGIDKENVILLLSKCGNRVDELLFVEKTDPIRAKWVGEKIRPELASEISGIENIKFIDEFEDELHSILSQDYSRVENLYFDLERMKYNSPITKNQAYAEIILKKYPYINIKNTCPIISKLRTIKCAEEIELIQSAIQITNEGIKNIMRNSKPGMMEYEIEAHFDFTLKSKGVTDFAFKTIAAAGDNATVLHYGDNNCVASDNDLILFDLGAQYKYYNADITRTFPVNGKFTPRQREIYEIVLKAQRAVIEMIKPGISYKELNVKCKTVLAEECMRIGLIKCEEEISKYYYHGVSHYLGLDTHDVGSRECDLEQGMVLTVEPGLYIKEERIGIRIEDNVLVTDNGHEILSKDIIKTIQEIENFMKN
jgi:Xaa-Pro aminopeptidase